MKSHKLILFGSLFVGIVFSLGLINFAEAIPCNAYERNNGKIICISEYTAVKLLDRGWELTKIVEIMDNDPPVVITNIESKPIVEKITEIPIPNPTGYWVPIPEEDREDFAMKFAIAAGDSFVEKNDDGEYVTEKGKINFHSTVVSYKLQDLTINDKDEQRVFVSNFMKSMEFEYDEMDFTHTSRIGPDLNYYGLFISNDVNKIGFAFDGIFDGTLITFNGWINNPETLVFPLSEELAIQKAIDFTLENVEREYALENSDAYHSYHRECNLKMFDDILTSKYVISGLPYYDVFTGYCDNGMAAIDGVEDIKIIIDGQIGEDISWRMTYN